MLNGNYVMCKRSDFIHYPANDLELDKYVIHPDHKEHLYDLIGIVCHQGIAMGGHYYSYCKNHLDKWYKFDDETVTEASGTDIYSTNAYILFYQRKTLPMSVATATTTATTSSPATAATNSATPIFPAR